MPLYGCVTPNGYSWTVGSVGEHQRAGESHEFCVVDGGKPVAGNFNRVGSDRKREQRHGDAGDESFGSGSAGGGVAVEALLVTGGVSDSTRAAVLQQFEQQKDQNSSAAADAGWRAGTAEVSRTRGHRNGKTGSAAGRVVAWLTGIPAALKETEDAESDQQAIFSSPRCAGCCGNDGAPQLPRALGAGRDGGRAQSADGGDLSAGRGGWAQRRGALSREELLLRCGRALRFRKTR